MKHRPRFALHYEHMNEPLASPAVFRQRVLASSVLTGFVLAISLLLGMAGYHWLVGMPRWVDCLYSASMIMGGMGPVGKDPDTDAGKIFASAYALYAGVMLLASVGLLLSPMLHRLLHGLHVDTEE